MGSIKCHREDISLTADTFRGVVFVDSFGKEYFATSYVTYSNNGRQNTGKYTVICHRSYSKDFLTSASVITFVHLFEYSFVCMKNMSSSLFDYMLQKSHIYFKSETEFI